MTRFSPHHEQRVGTSAIASMHRFSFISLSYTVFLLTPGISFSGVALKVFKPSDWTKHFFMSVSWVWRDIGAGLSVYLWLWLM